MFLLSFRIQNCFGFQDSGDINFSDSGNLTYLLGRNSSGKTSVLTALDTLEGTEQPQRVSRFQNYEQLSSTPQRPPLTARYSVSTEDGSIFSADRLLMLILQIFNNTGLSIKQDGEGYSVHAGKLHRPNVENVLADIYRIYSEFISRVFLEGQLVVQRAANGSYAFFAAGDPASTQQDRLEEVDSLLSSAFGSPPKVVNAQNQNVQVTINPQQIENFLYRLVTEIVDFTSMFSVEDDLPREISQNHLAGQDNKITEAFVSVLGVSRLRELLTANRDATIRRLESELNSTLETLCEEINSGISTSLSDEGFVDISLRKQKDTLNVEIQVDGGPSYFEHLSDATKFLIAYNLIRRDREEKNYLSSVLIFDEPNKGFHPSAESKVLNFLETLAQQGNQVILSTHSQHMIDLQRTHAMRIMGKDQDQHLLVHNKISEVPNSQEGTLALQPMTDAIGLKYSSQRIVKDKIIVTEGYTELVYLRAFATLLGFQAPDISPVLGDGKIRTLISLLISQGLSFKVVVDEAIRRQELNKDIGIPDTSVFVVEEYLQGKQGKTVGIEDLFSRKDFEELLKLAGQTINYQKISNVSNSGYLKGTGKKGLLANTFSEEISAKGNSSLPVETETRDNFQRVLQFCHDSSWFSA